MFAQRHYESDSVYSEAHGAARGVMSAAVLPKGPPSAGYRILGLVPIITAGYIIAALVLLEGVLLLCAAAGCFWGPSGGSPVHGLQHVVLWVWGVADVLVAVAGTVGLVMARAVLPLGLHRCQTAEAAGLLVLSAVPWRLLVTICAAPWVGTVLAFGSFSAAEKVGIVCGFVAYLAVNIYAMWILVLVAQAARSSGHALEQLIAQQSSFERRHLAQLAHQRREQEEWGWLESRALFGCVPADVGVFAYAVVLLLAGFWGLLRMTTAGQTVGGWALLSDVPLVDSTTLIETFLHLITIFAALVGIVGMVVQRRVDDDDPEVALGLQKWRSQALMFFFVANCMRCALLIPITGMVLLAENLCGLYIHGLSDEMAYGSRYVDFVVPVHCTPSDLLTLLGTGALVALDAYMLLATFQVWQWYHAGYVHHFQYLRLESGTDSYGAGVGFLK